MDENEVQHRLATLSTLWTVVLQAHREGDDAVAARRQLLERYIGPVYRYLLGAVHDGDTADDLFQDFAVRFLRGDFKQANPEKGRFRDFLRTALINLVRNHKKRKPALPLAVEVAEPAAEASAEDEFTKHWREELLRRTWAALQAFEKESGKPYHSVLHLKAEYPELSSTQRAERLSAQLGRPLSSDAERQALHRARTRFAELLIEEVKQSLRTDDEERIEQELIDLQLFSYCQGILRRAEG